MKTAELFIEIQTEELPPKALNRLRLAFAENITAELKALQLHAGDCQSFATPRRLAVWISGLPLKQADQKLQKRGPAVSQAYDADGKPTPACVGFAKSCGAQVSDLKTVETDKGAWVICNQHVPGKATATLLPEVFQKAIKQLPVPKWMHWGNHPDSFARPVHHITVLFAGKVLKTELLGLKTHHITVGHRVLCHKPLVIKKPAQYENLLRQVGHVIACFDKRQAMINTQIEALASKHQLTPVIDPALLEEVTGLVEWPTAYLATFDRDFLALPEEVLISAMQDHQKSFPLRDASGKLNNQFMFISNIAPKDPNITIKGNEKVMTARLSDAKFFYDTDCKTPLFDRVEQLKQVTFQQSLGTLHDKAKRLSAITAKLCDDTQAERTGWLAKADLLTDMVFEFTDLQGTMGYYYALHDQEPESIAIALKEQYLPRFAEDAVAKTPLGIALSIADKLDNLVACFGVNKIPTGNKDPFALRRAAIGIIRTIIENQLSIDMASLIEFTLQQFTVPLPNQSVLKSLLSFFQDRLRVWLKDQGDRLEIIDAVLSLQLSDFYDCSQRVSAVKSFAALPEASSLAAANKRVNNILQKNTDALSDVNPDHFDHPAESRLFDAVVQQEQSAFIDYTTTLKQLATLKPHIDAFFEDVLVNAEDNRLRLNRLSLLARLRTLFLQVADIAMLQHTE